MAPSLPPTQTQLVLLRRPVGAIDPSLSGQGTFGKKSVPVTKAADLKPDEVIMAVEWLSLDPAMRGKSARDSTPGPASAVSHAGAVGATRPGAIKWVVAAR